MFQFTIFRIPVRVEPWFWLTAFLLGGGFNINSRDSLIQTMLWMGVVFVSILIHELGHALTSRHLTRVEPSISLVAMGGLAYPNTHLTRRHSFFVTWAGPLAGLAFFVVTVLVCCLIFSFPVGLGLTSLLLFGNSEVSLETLEAFVGLTPFVRSLLSSLFFINFWWSLVNLLPVYPLDGGQIYASLESSQQRVHQVGFVTALAAALAGFFFLNSIFIPIVFGFLAYQNYKSLTYRR